MNVGAPSDAVHGRAPAGVGFGLPAGCECKSLAFLFGTCPVAFVFVTNMLTIMQPTLWWFNFVGVLGHKRSEHPHGETLLTIVRRTVTILVMLVNPYPQTVYLFANLDNIIEAAFSIYFVVVGVGMLVQLCVLMRNRVAVRQLVDHIEAIVNESEWTDFSRSL